MSHPIPVAECGQALDFVLYTPEVCQRLAELVREAGPDGVDVAVGPPTGAKSIPAAAVCGHVTHMAVVDGVLLAQAEPAGEAANDFYGCMDSGRCRLRPAMVFLYDPVGENKRPNAQSIRLLHFHLWKADGHGATP